MFLLCFILFYFIYFVVCCFFIYTSVGFTVALKFFERPRHILVIKENPKRGQIKALCHKDFNFWGQNCAEIKYHLLYMKCNKSTKRKLSTCFREQVAIRFK